MNSPLENQFRTQIQSLTGFPFQDFIVKLFLIKYGSNGFIPPRKVQDKGSDGIIVSESRSISCYAPEKYSERESIKKITDDFKSYKENWNKNYSNWTFIVNHELTPEEINTVTEVKKDGISFGVTQIVNLIINELNHHKRKEVAKYLKIDSQYFTSDFIKMFLDDLLKEASETVRTPFKNATYLPDKIELNFLPEERGWVADEFFMANENFSLIDSVMKSYEDGDIHKIKSKVILDYNLLSGRFSEKLNTLTEKYSFKYADDEYTLLIRAFLLYIFEQCLIGIKTQEELKK